jgi:ribonuclease J
LLQSGKIQLPMQITIHRGTHEIGGNCVEIATDNSRIILDVGMPLFKSEGVPYDTGLLKRKSKQELLEAGILPKVPGLFIEGSKPDAILLSHAHEDHTGLLRHSNREIPIYTSKGTSKMMMAGAKFALQPVLPRERYREIESNTPVQFGDFTITAYSVDHSIYGAQAFLIEADGKTALYSGDLRMHGRKPGMHRSLIEAIAPRNIDVLLMEGTHIGHPGHKGVNEYQLEDEITELIKSASGITLASFSPQHVDRLVGMLRATKKSGKVFVADAYTAFVMRLIASETSVPSPESTEWVKVFFPKFFLESYERKRMQTFFSLMAPARIEMDEIRSVPSNYVMIFRPSMMDSDFGGTLPNGARCLYSRWSGYLEQQEWQTTQAKLSEVNGDLIELHTSGHIFYDDIVDFVGQIDAKKVIPIHTFEAERFSDYFDYVTRLSDGEVFQIE